MWPGEPPAPAAAPPTHRPSTPSTPAGTSLPPLCPPVLGPHSEYGEECAKGSSVGAGLEPRCEDRGTALLTPSSAMFLSGWEGAEPSEAPALGSLGPAPHLPIPIGTGSPYLLHLLLAHAKLVVAKQKGPDVLAELVLHTAIVNLPQQLQLLVVLRDPGSEDCAAPTVTVAPLGDPISRRAGDSD